MGTVSVCGEQDGRRRRGGMEGKEKHLVTSLESFSLSHVSLVQCKLVCDGAVVDRERGREERGEERRGEERGGSGTDTMELFFLLHKLSGIKEVHEVAVQAGLRREILGR